MQSMNALEQRDADAKEHCGNDGDDARMRSWRSRTRTGKDWD